MSFKKLSKLAVLGLLGVSAKGMEELKCTHDHQEIPEPDFLEVDEDYNPDGNDHSGRLLTSYSNLRTYAYYGELSSTTSAMRAYIETLVPPIMDYWAGVLKVKYPVNGNMKVSSSSVCGVSTPSVLKNGVAADYVYFIEADVSSDYVASSYACTLASGSKRPLIGHTYISTTYMQPSTDVLINERNMICILHETVHTLGFSKSLYAHWLNSSGKTLTGHVTSATLDGATSVVINAEPLTTKVRDYFGCPTLKGAYMENSGSGGTDGSHFERRQFAFEAMTSGLILQMQFSQFTLALLESSGWYVVDYSYADEFHFGEGEGCNFLLGTCSATEYPEWCSSSARGCTNVGRGGGTCESDVRSDNCKFVHPVEQYDCENVDAESYARIPDIQTYGRGLGSKCFTGTLNTKKAGSQTTFCFKPTCSGSGTSTKLTLNVGGKEVVCSKAGNVSVSGYAGTIDCPDPLTFCSTVGAPVCPRGCMGRGSCNDGVCSCNSGYKGTDCSLAA